MKQRIQTYYRLSHHLKDLSITLIVFMLPFIYYFFRRSIVLMQDLSMVSQVWFMSMAILLGLYLLSLAQIIRMEQQHPELSFEFSKIKDTRYPTPMLAGFILGTTIINLLFYVLCNISSYYLYTNLLVIYQYYPFFIIIHLELFIFMVFLLIHLTQVHQKQYMPLLGLFAKDINRHHMKKPIHD